jgi:transcriptional regulator with XRE-family HTH domain
MANDQALITRRELMKLTREARGDRKQNEVAEELGVSQSAISQAENKEKASLDDLRKKIISHYLDVLVEGPAPYFKLIKDPES